MKTPSLDLWRKELAAGARTKTTVDALWRAACAESAALEFLSIAPGLAAAYRDDARRIILEAAKRKGTVTA